MLVTVWFGLNVVVAAAAAWFCYFFRLADGRRRRRRPSYKSTFRKREREREKKQKNKAVVRALCDVCIRYGSEIKEPTPPLSPLLLTKQIRFLNTLAL